MTHSTKHSVTLKSRIVAGTIAVAATTGLIFTLSAAPAANATISSSASVATVPLCVWNITGVTAAISLTHPSTSPGDAHVNYVGNDFYLTGSQAAPTLVYVAKLGNLAASTTDEDNCSFYTANATAQATSGAVITLAIPGSTGKFTAKITGVEDPAMTFPLDGVTPSGSTKPQTLTVTLAPSACKNDSVTGVGNNWVTANGDIFLDSGSSPSTEASLAKTYTTTSSSCSFGTGLALYIPGGKTPGTPGGQYTYTGPSLVTTLTVPGN